MTYQIGRRINVGISRETVRGVSNIAPQFWLPKMDLSIDDKVNFVVNDQSYAVIEDAIGQDLATTYSEGSVTGRIDYSSFGLLMLATFGNEVSQAAHAGETVVYDHIFSVSESAQHPSLSISAVGDNEGTGVRYKLGMINQLDIMFEINKYCTYKAAFRANTSVAVASTAAFSTVEVPFLPQQGSVKFATNLAGLAAASAINLRKLNLTVKKNIEEDWTIGSTSAADRVNKEFSIEGTLEIVYDSRTYIDTNLAGNVSKAMRIQAVNTATTIGVAANPSLTIDLPLVKIQEVARKITNKDLVMQTLKFKAFYSQPDAEMMTTTLVNKQSAAY